ncbi:MAG: hypothetical protein FJ315_01985 [SAR202 cluster bacterium]|nr:hypothetical protein [SAR202 cluster bacterium]
MVGHIGIVALKVQDWEKMVTFYRDTLGLPARVFDVENQYAMFDTGAVRFAVEAGGVASTFPKGAGQNPVQVNFQTDALEQTVSGLKRRGVNFVTQVKSGPGYDYIVFADPEGNQQVLYQRAAR